MDSRLCHLDREGHEWIGFIFYFTTTMCVSLLIARLILGKYVNTHIY